MTDQEYMQVALDEARKAAEIGEVPIGAILVRKGEIISRAHNLRETTHCATAHAELLAIREACRVAGGWRLTESTLYVTVEPCPMCAGAILQSRIDRVVIGAMDLKAGACGSVINLLRNPRFNHQAEVETGILEESCAGEMKTFFRYLRK